MNRNEPPIFGENGAVLNSDTMTDEWRAEHEKTTADRMKDENSKLAAGMVQIMPAFLCLQTATLLLPADISAPQRALICLSAFILGELIGKTLYHTVQKHRQ